MRTRVSFVSALLMLALAGRVAGNGLSLEMLQLDYVYGGATSVADSEWGRLEVSYAPTATQEYLNVVVGGQWLIQNHPLLSSSEAGAAIYSSQQLVDLGSALSYSRGTDVSGASMNFSYTVSATPQLSSPGSGVSGALTIGSGQELTNSGVPSGVTSLNAPVSVSLPWGVPIDGVIRSGMPNVTQEDRWCGPGSAANSLHWLKNSKQIALSDSLDQTAKDLAANMGTDHIGTWDDAEVRGKLKYIKDKKLPLNVHYAGSEKLPKVGDYTDPNGNGTAINDGAITNAWLLDQMKKGQDIELMTNTHWVVVEAVIQITDSFSLIEYRDDNFQHASATTAAERAALDKRHVWTYLWNGHINIGNGDEVLKAAVAESVPLPGAVWAGLLLLGGCFVARRCRRGRA